MEESSNRAESVDGSDSVGGEETDEQTTANTEEISYDDVNLFENGKTEFTVVISNNVSSTVSNAAKQLQQAFSSNLGVSLNIRNEDYFKLINNGSLKGKKIVVGTLSGDSIGIDIEKPLRDSGYVIKVIDGSLYIVGGTDESTAQAVTYFVNSYVRKNSKSIKFEPGVIYEKKTTAQISNMTVSGNEIWKYKIVHHDSVFAEECAKSVQQSIAKITGYTLPIYKDSVKKEKYEILVGKTDRTESKSVRNDYNRPNVYFDIVVKGEKLVIMGEGYTTLRKASEMFDGYISTMSEFGAALTNKVKSGDVLSSVDSEAGESMAQISSGTDVRVMHWNMAAPYLSTENAIYKDNKTRGEVMADIILQMYPDVITTNEFYKSHNGDSTFFNAVMGEIGEYYDIIDSKYELDKPTEGAKPIEGKTINSNILCKKSKGFSVVWSGWRYATEKTDITENNPDGWVYYHGYHSAVLESKTDGKFIISVAHNADSKTTSKWCEEHLAAAANAQANSGSSTALPTILTGDMFTCINVTPSSATGYNYIKNEGGFSDAQISADVNANSNEGCRGSDKTRHGTFHDIGVRDVTRASEDFVWYKNGLHALKFKVLVSKDLDETSDHYPVIADLKFN